MRRLVTKHPKATRWFHWFNVPLLFVMIWSGMQIYWANDVYRIGVGAFTLFRFFPKGFYETLDLSSHLAQGMAWHFFFMWLFAANGIAYVTYTILSGEWRELWPGRRALPEAWHVTLHYLHLTKKPLPDRKYNAGQRLGYTGIILAGFGSLLTGLAIYRPVQLSWLTAILGGYQMARWFHFWLTIGYVVFFIGHITMVIHAGWSNSISMITGCELKDEAAHDTKVR